MTKPEPARLRELIAASGVSIRELSRRSGVDHANIVRIAGGDTDPRLSTVAKLLAACGATWADLGPGK